MTMPQPETAQPSPSAAHNAESDTDQECAHNLCSCQNAPVVHNNSTFCSELCAEAADLVDKNTTLCPCLHQGCEGNGDKPLRPEQREMVGTPTR